MNGFQRKFRLLVGLDAALVLLIALGIAFSPTAASARSTRRSLVTGIDAVATIHIDGSESITLARSGSDWLLRSADGDLPADAPRVQAFLKAVDAVKSMEPVAHDSSSWQSLGLDGASSRHVRLLDAKGGTMADFIVGRYATSPNAVYLALTGSTDAFSVASGMASYVQGTHASWLDLKAWTTPPAVEAVQEVEVHGKVKTADGTMVNESYTIARSGNAWKSGATVLDPSRVEAMIRAIAAIRGEDYVPQSAPKAEAATSIIMRLGNGRTLELDIEPGMDDGRHQATSSQRSRRLYLPAWTLTEALRPLSELVPAKP